ncbi:hypothetical protein N9V90_00460 [Endozoicomonas sp.]|nr:hypothetical protein [Endozoicomonas sp.]
MSIAYTAPLQPNITDTQQLPANNTDWQALDEYNRVIDHQIYHCPLYTWLAMGWRKNKDKNKTQEYHLYIEFRDASGSSRYQTRTFHSLKQALHFQRKKAQLMTLSTISTKHTTLRPIGVT